MSVIQKDGTVSGDWRRTPRDIEVQEAGLGCMGRSGTEGGTVGHEQVDFPTQTRKATVERQRESHVLRAAIPGQLRQQGGAWQPKG